MGLRQAHGIIPRQHGAWSILIISFFIGSLAEGPMPMRSWALLAMLLTGFAGQHMLQSCIGRPRHAFQRNLLRLRWPYGFVLLSAGLGLWLILGQGLLWIALFTGTMILMAIGAYVLKARGKSFMAELLGTIGLSLTALISAYCRSGRVSAYTVGLWLTCSALFVGGVFRVRYLARCHTRHNNGMVAQLRCGLPSLAFHTLALAAAFSLSWASSIIPRFVGIVFIPGFLQTLWSVFTTPRGGVQFRQLGLAELSHALGCAILLLFFYRL